MALIDAADLPKVRLFKWRAKKNYRNWYAITDRHGQTSMHRLIADAKPGEKIDHQDGNGLHNWRANLRRATNAQNVRNARIYSRKTTSKYKGVYFRKDLNKFQSQIMMLGKKINLGVFQSEEEAARTYDTHARKLFGKFARCNFEAGGAA